MGDRVPDLAARGFGSDGARYDRGRPSYPAAAVRHVAEVVGADRGTVLDLGAGTGKFTALLPVTTGLLVAAEPVAEMRARIRHHAPASRVVASTAERIPLASGSVDGVVVAQAFHWFDRHAALAEIGRVLRPGGGLAVVFNSRDERVAWVRELSAVIRWNSGAIPTYDRGDERWLEMVAGTPWVHGAEERVFDYDHTVDRAGFVARIESVSYIAELAPDERADVVARALDVVAPLGFPLKMPYRTLVYAGRRR